MTDELKNLYNVATNAPTAPTSETVLHVRVQGRSRDIALDVLGLTGSASDEAIRTAVANFMELPPETLTSTVIERHPNGNLTLRPEAVFG
jgi:hypothetical protein